MKARQMNRYQMKRYNDNAFDYLFSKLEGAYNTFKVKFGKLPTARKILYLIGKAMQAFSIASGATNIVTLLAVQKKVQAIRALLNGAAWSIPVPIIGTVIGKTIGGLANAMGNRFEQNMNRPLFKKIFEDILTFGLGLIAQKIAEYGPEAKTKAKEFIGRLRGKKDSARRLHDAFYNDSLLGNLIDKIKGYFVGLKKQIGSLPVGKKILFAIAKIIKWYNVIQVTRKTAIIIKGLYEIKHDAELAGSQFPMLPLVISGGLTTGLVAIINGIGYAAGHLIQYYSTKK